MRGSSPLYKYVGCVTLTLGASLPSPCLTVWWPAVRVQPPKFKAMLLWLIDTSVFTVRSLQLVVLVEENSQM